MSKIKIKNFGPIKSGVTNEDEWLDIKRVTVFIGNQGSGKSTVAKLISTLTWIEKALVRGDFTSEELSADIIRLHCSYQKIDSYFRKDTSIEYYGRAYIIRYIDGDANAAPNLENGYSFPKIMYVPSERNLVGSIRNVGKLKGLPSTLYTFADEFFDALETIDGRMDLPINGATLEFESLTKIVNIRGLDYSVELPIASSGFQSFVPLFLVTDYLAKSLTKKADLSKNQLSIDEERRLMNEVRNLMDDPTLSYEIKRIRLRQLSAERDYAAFINIVEEPEQNLFPSSQRNALNSLLMSNNINENNKLVLTTHSPYLINYLTLAVKAYSISSTYRKNPEILKKLSEIVPLNALVNPNDLVIYEMEEKDGTIKKLEFYYGLPSDENYLNNSLSALNDLFDNLISIEQKVNE
jgi:predicted ATPase